MKRILSILVFTGIIWAQEKSELIIDVEQSLMATCCWSGTVYDHGNKEMELNIAAMVGEGKTKAQILDYYTEQYGERVLAVPKAEGFNIFAWIAPIFIFGLGLTIIFLYMRTSKDNLTPIVNADDTIAYSDEIEQELKDLD
ncbi:MAG: cytochrome c-type biogenesis protein CcmH [Candidatus Marinimicrobia bacterium]|nr:cytochrome c-type biogenesis protein CcmH [Candidatus Neomarinimicrobiota bacterium]MDD9888053.1 cytochrome c-type biogenesis protein CcmH [Candidatus Neomarinimicrobiota bacterium]MDD9931016.1 cytochrome c-type biogenesis protein CcmH [Candidatus Neomarinimicrobiota bacterium]